jgi:hypothetical protein
MLLKRHGLHIEKALVGTFDLYLLLVKDCMMCFQLYIQAMYILKEITCVCLGNVLIQSPFV